MSRNRFGWRSACLGVSLLVIPVVSLLTASRPEIGAIAVAGPASTATPHQLVLIAGGVNAQAIAILQTAELFDTATRKFVCVGGVSGTGACNHSMTDARYNGTATRLFNGKVLLAAGNDNRPPRGVVNTAEIFDAASRKFTCVGGVSSSPPLCKSSMTDVRFAHIAALLDPRVISGPRAGMVLIAGGDDLSNPTFGTPLRTAELYNPVTGKFICVGGVSAAPPKCKPSMTIARVNAVAALLTIGQLKGQVLVVGGQNQNGFISTAELYNPATGIFKATIGKMNDSHVLPSITELKSGLVLIAGGENGAGNSSDGAELFDPATQKFTCVGGGFAGFGCNHTMVDGREFFAATLLPSGQVFLTGGFNNAGSWIASTELFNPVNKTFTFAGNMTSPRGHQSVTLIGAGPLSGQVLIGGGNDNSGNILETAELYNPATGKFTCVGGVSGAPPRCNPSLHEVRRQHYALLVAAAGPLPTRTPSRTPTRKPTRTPTKIPTRKPTPRPTPTR